jgi:glycosyltransferase involved in cell wall biosynthesis
MATGLPVVCTRSGTRDLAIHRRTAWVVPFRNSFFLRRGLRAIHDDPRLAARLGEAARAHVAQFSWPSVADQMEAVLRRHLSR